MSYNYNIIIFRRLNYGHYKLKSSNMYECMSIRLVRCLLRFLDYLYVTKWRPFELWCACLFDASRGRVAVGLFGRSCPQLVYCCCRRYANFNDWARAGVVRARAPEFGRPPLYLKVVWSFTYAFIMLRVNQLKMCISLKQFINYCEDGRVLNY